MRLAEHGNERHGEDLVAGSIADVQDPTAPVFRTGRHDQRPHHQGGVVTRLGQIANGSAVLIDHYPFSVGAMEIDLSHVPPPNQSEEQARKIAAATSAGNSDGLRTGFYGERGRRPRRDRPLRLTPGPGPAARWGRPFSEAAAFAPPVAPWP